VAQSLRCLPGEIETWAQQKTFVTHNTSEHEIDDFDLENIMKESDRLYKKILEEQKKNNTDQFVERLTRSRGKRLPKATKEQMFPKAPAFTPRRCSFCGKAVEEVKKLVAGPDVYICDECIELCVDILQEESEETKLLTGIPKPKEIKAFLDQYVIGQEHAKKVLSVAVFNHYQRINHKNPDVELQKSNILLLGPTGSGKTLLAQTLARFLNVPFVIADSTCLTEAGYVGEDVESIIASLYQSAKYDLDKTQRGIVYIDEFDKLSRKTDSATVYKDVSGEGVQQALLKLLEGSIINVPPKGGRKHPNQEFISIDTKNILFICGGAFVGLDDIVKRRSGTKTIGFERVAGEQESCVIPQDLIKYGLIPELVGRLPVICSTEKLSKEEIIRIIKEPKNSILKQYETLLNYTETKLEISDEVMDLIAEKAIKNDTGARSLRTVFEKLLLDVMFEAGEHNTIEITMEMVENV